MKHSVYKSREELPMYLTVMDVADLLGISRASAYELVREQNFPKLKIVTGRIIIPRDRLLEWLDEQTRYDSAVTSEICEARKSPAILVLPGGGYAMVSDREAEPIALTYAAAGYHAFVLRYSTVPARFPTQLREAAMAMIYIRENADALHVRADRVAAIGFSAGGHLCACLGTLFDDASLNVFGEKKKLVRPEAAIYAYAVITSGKYTSRCSFKNLCDGDTALLEELSLEERVTKDSTPAFIFATAADDCVPVMNSLKIAEAYAAHGVPFSLYIAERGCHGLSLGNGICYPVGTSSLDTMSKDYALWPQLSLTWLKERDFVPQD